MVNTGIDKTLEEIKKLRYRAKWKTHDQLAHLRKNKSCFRCERKGCNTLVCHLLPARNPAEKDGVEIKVLSDGKAMYFPKENDRKIYRAKWKTQDQLERLRRDNCCFRCERKGCKTFICPLLPAKRPAEREVQHKDTKAPLDFTQSKIETREDSFESEISEMMANRNGLGQKAVLNQEKKMNTAPFLVNALINDTRIPILPRSLETAEESSDDKPIVKDITYVSLDLDGYVTERLWLYVVPHSAHQMILGKKWLEDQDAVIHSKEQRLELRKSGGNISSVERWQQRFKEVEVPRTAPEDVVVSMIRTVPVCRASLTDINKALRTKSKLTIEEARRAMRMGSPCNHRGVHYITCLEKSCWFCERP